MLPPNVALVGHCHMVSLPLRGNCNNVINQLYSTEPWMVQWSTAPVEYSDWPWLWFFAWQFPSHWVCTSVLLRHSFLQLCGGLTSLHTALILASFSMEGTASCGCSSFSKASQWSLLLWFRSAGWFQFVCNAAFTSFSSPSKITLKVERYRLDNQPQLSHNLLSLALNTFIELVVLGAWFQYGMRVIISPPWRDVLALSLP